MDACQFALYTVNGEVTVEDGATLTIEPGVTVKFKTGTECHYEEPDFDLVFLRINGKLIAEGTEDDNITFKRDGQSGNWGMIFFNEADTTSSLKKCRIEHAYSIYNLIIDTDFYGALSFFETDGVAVEKCHISDNNNYGVSCYHSSPNITNNTINSNGGGIYCLGSSPSITNNTINNNNYYGIACKNSSPNITNTIIWNNTEKLILNNEDSNPSVSYSCIEGEYEGIGNISSNPQFADAANSNFQLSSNSPCINAGTPDTSGLNLPNTDLASNPRISGGRIDIGAYEH